MTLPNGWRIEGIIERAANATGGHFSICYRATNLNVPQDHPQRTGVLKAFDYSSAEPTSDPLRAIQIMAAEFNFERDLVKLCESRRMRNVVTGLADGNITLAGYLPPLNQVPYLILEAANGDIRSTIQMAANLDLAWTFHTLHNVSNGLHALHQAGIIHQDVKPSNILDFGDNRKVGDLGRAHRVGVSVPHDELLVPGDYHYAPPEQLYDWKSEDRNVQRLAGDLYQLGNLMCFMLLGASSTTLLLSRLDSSHRPAVYGGGYLDVLPELRRSFGYILGQIDQLMPNSIRESAVSVFRELSDPDVRLRGSPKAMRLSTDRLSMQRYVSRFDNLARRSRFVAQSGT